MVLQAAQGHFTTEAEMWNQNKAELTSSNRTVTEFEEELRRKMTDRETNPRASRYQEMFSKDKKPEGYLEAPLAYDAVWAVALGRNSSERLNLNLTILLCSTELERRLPRGEKSESGRLQL